MMCAWKKLLSILPPEIGAQLDDSAREGAQEIRLRLNAPPEVSFGSRRMLLKGQVTGSELDFVINTASRYSPWCAASLTHGYLTAPGGHRIGICGEAVVQQGQVTGFRRIRSLCIRVARDFPGIGAKAPGMDGSILILGAPGWGKTTLLRDISRQIAKKRTVCVVDERGELFPDGFCLGDRMDILTGVPKPAGIEMALRTMGPAYIAVDEITAEIDCAGLVHAANCGVRLLATAHAADSEDLKKREIYRNLLDKGIFQTLLVLHGDKSYHGERMAL